MATNRITDPTRIRALIAEHETWYHQIELAPGITTPGIHHSKLAIEHLDALGLPQDLTDLRVVDIGSRDGFFAFEMERRGADVVAIDYLSLEASGFSIAKKILGSAVRHVTRNVYELDPERHGYFDLVLFLGVLYHLRHPLLALEKIRRVVKEDGLVLVETQLATDTQVRQSQIPVWQFFPRGELHDDPTSKWGPNTAGLVAALQESQFEVLATEVHGERGYARARAIVDHELEYFRRLDTSSGGEPV